jgi:hypothetical protein
MLIQHQKNGLLEIFYSPSSYGLSHVPKSVTPQCAFTL